VQEPPLGRVQPGNPNDSYLIHKLEGTQNVGGRMPLGGTPLSTADIAVVRQWILNGAPGTTTTPTNPIRVTSLSPLPGSTVAATPLSVTAVFDRELNASTVDSTTFRVRRSGGDGTFGNGNDVDITPTSVTVPLANPMTAVFSTGAAVPAIDTYEVRLVGTGTAILDLAANALDGEFSGTFPSGNATAGGDFVAQFTIQGVQPTLQSIQDNVFTPRCAICHSGPTSGVLPAGMDLSSLSMSFLALVNVPSLQVGTLDRVEPNNPDASYLVRKIEGTAAVGAQMPFGAPPLDAATITAIRQWITNGAAM
jgi:hypothetical protein